MRRLRVQMTAVALMTLTLLGGCGEAPYELTEAEENVIVNYAAHVVTKYNSYQKEGLTYVDLEAAGEETAAEQMVAETQTQPDVQAETSGDAQDNALTVPEYQSATLTDLFGAPGLTVDYVGARLANGYAKGGYYALYPDAGNIYLILGVDITNSGETPIVVDYLAKNAGFEVFVNNEVSSKAETTILTEDFSTFASTLGAGETRETILLFQVPETVTSLDTLDLVVSAGDNCQIILENE